MELPIIASIKAIYLYRESRQGAGEGHIRELILSVLKRFHKLGRKYGHRAKNVGTIDGPLSVIGSDLPSKEHEGGYLGRAWTHPRCSVCRHKFDGIHGHQFPVGAS
jgi:hypothetical protein